MLRFRRLANQSRFSSFLKKNVEDLPAPKEGFFGKVVSKEGFLPGFLNREYTPTRVPKYPGMLVEGKHLVAPKAVKANLYLIVLTFIGLRIA